MAEGAPALYRDVWDACIRSRIVRVEIVGNLARTQPGRGRTGWKVHHAAARLGMPLIGGIKGFVMSHHDGFLDSDELPRSSRLAAGVVDVTSPSGG
jgi:hypothetical protein